jgi:hypothetical protein
MRHPICVFDSIVWSIEVPIRYGNETPGVPGGAASRGTNEALWADALTSERPVEAMKLGWISGAPSPYKRN